MTHLDTHRPPGPRRWIDREAPQRPCVRQPLRLQVA